MQVLEEEPVEPRRLPRRAATTEELQEIHRSYSSAQSNTTIVQHGSGNTVTVNNYNFPSTTTWCRHTAEDTVFLCHQFHIDDHQDMPKRMRAQLMKSNLELVDQMADGKHQYHLRSPGQTKRRVCCQAFAAYFGLQRRTVEKALKAGKESQATS